MKTIFQVVGLVREQQAKRRIVSLIFYGRVHIRSFGNKKMNNLFFLPWMGGSERDFLGEKEKDEGMGLGVSTDPLVRFFPPVWPTSLVGHAVAWAC